MDALKIKYEDYLRLVGCRAVYNLSNGTMIDFTYQKENFIHLAGLHKLTDIQLIQFYNDKNNKTVKASDVLKKIKNEDFTDAMVRGSSKFSQIEMRYNGLTYDKLTSMTYTDAIINFDPSKIGSVIKSDYLLYEQNNGGYNHLGVALDNASSSRYIETFFYEVSDKYLRNQTVVSVNNFVLYNADGTELLRDSF